MATITGLTADRIMAFEGLDIVDADIDANGDLIMTRRDGTTFNVGNVFPPDTGWLNFNFNAGFQSYDEVGYKVKYRKEGNRVSMKGLVKKTDGTNLGTGNVTIGTMPVGFRPPTYFDIVQVTSATGTYARGIFQDTGGIILQNVGSVTWAGLVADFYIN